MLRKLLHLSLVFLVIAGGYTGYTYLMQPIAPHFRTTDDSPQFWRRIKGIAHGYTTFNRQGLEKLKVIGSGYLDLDQFNKLEKLHHVEIVFNAMPEDVWYIQNKPLKFYCIERRENQLVSAKKSGFKGVVCKFRRLVKKAETTLNPTTTKESEFLKTKGIKLEHPMRDNWLDDWSFVNNLIHHFETKNESQYYYYHCGHGQGRTTTLMALHDIFLNAREVSLPDIFARHYLIGGEDLKDIEEWQGGTWDREELLSRRNLLVAFYLFMTDKDGYKTNSWENWIKLKAITPKSNDLWIKHNFERN